MFLIPKEINKNLKCTNLLSLTYYGVLNKDFTGSGGLRPKDYETYQNLSKDDLVFKMIDLENMENKSSWHSPRRSVIMIFCIHKTNTFKRKDKFKCLLVLL